MTLSVLFQNLMVQVKSFQQMIYLQVLPTQKMLTDRFSIGGSFKYIQQNIWHSTARTFAVDVGTLFETPFMEQG